MSTGETWQTDSTSLDDTLALAEQIGHNLRGGEVLELVSDLGGGKTAFVRGLARGVNSKDVVRSPSFTLSNEYKGEKLTLYHLDFYRLQEPGIMRDELQEMIEDPNGVVVVEWANIVEDVLPADHVTISIRATGEASRTFSFNYPEKLEYLIKFNT